MSGQQCRYGWRSEGLFPSRCSNQRAIRPRKGATLVRRLTAMDNRKRNGNRIARALVAAVVLTGSCLLSPTVMAQTFSDVPTDYWAYDFIETLAAQGVTGGCGNGQYCPEAPVTRAQMAVFLERGLKGSDFAPPAATGNVFLDVAAEDFAASFIEQLYLDG